MRSNEKGPFNVEEFEDRFTVDFQDNLQYMNPRVWEDLNRIWHRGPTFWERWRWFLYDLKGKLHDFFDLIRVDDEEDYYDDD